MAFVMGALVHPCTCLDGGRVWCRRRDVVAAGRRRARSAPPYGKEVLLRASWPRLGIIYPPFDACWPSAPAAAGLALGLAVLTSNLRTGRSRRLASL